MRTRSKWLLPTVALAMAIGACGDYGRVENAGPGDEETPAIVPERETEPLDAGLDSPDTPDIHEPETDEEEGLEDDPVRETTVPRVR